MPLRCQNGPGSGERLQDHWSSCIVIDISWMLVCWVRASYPSRYACCYSLRDVFSPLGVVLSLRFKISLYHFLNIAMKTNVMRLFGVDAKRDPEKNGVVKA